MVIDIIIIADWNTTQHSLLALTLALYVQRNDFTVYY